jgi:hypothetical protein
MEYIIGEKQVFFIHIQERCDTVNKYRILTYLSLNRFGPVQDDGRWRRYIKEVFDLRDEPKLFIYVRSKLLRWAGSVRRMDEM